jgi:ABC-2 type transport system permease protein
VSARALTLRQVGFENRSFWRNPPAAFFTFVFPLMFLVIFNMLFGNEEIEMGGNVVTGSQFYVPAIAAFSVITACYTNIAMAVATARDLGVLKRVRGTPLPPTLYLVARVLHASLIAVLLVAIVTLAGTLFYGVDPPTDKLPALLVTIVVGAASFAALGLAMTAVIPTAQAAPPIVNASILPLLFVSDIFVSTEGAPEALVTFAKLFPIWHYAHAMQAPFDPFVTGAGFEWTRLLVVAAWGAAGLFLARRFFSWEPRR